MLPPGTLIGSEYRVVRLLGRGGMGEVYEAVHERLQRRVALKTIRADIAVDPASLLRFRREAETAASLGHPNIVQVTDWKEPPGEPPFLVMEHLEGRALADVIEDERKLPPGRAASIGLQLLSGLETAHRAGIVHRDIKPGNIFLLSTSAMRDLVKIVDFGIAKMVVDVAATSRQALTDYGQVLGTLAYMAPEQAMGGEVDARADIFAAGATLFHALSGMRPTEAIVPGQPRAKLSEMAPWVDKKLAAVVDRAMERIPKDRFASAQEMADALVPFVDQELPPGSMTMPDGVNMRALMAARFSAETVSHDNDVVPPTVTFGGSGTALMPPMRSSQNPPRISQNPPISGPTSPPSPVSGPHLPPRAPPPKSSNWALWVVGGGFALLCLGVVALAVIMQTVALGRAGTVQNVEQGVIDGMKLKPCVPPTTCTKQREGAVTYPVCTKNAPPGAFTVGDQVLVTKGTKAYAGYVSEPSADGEHFVVKQIVGSDADDVTPAEMSRLCR